MARGRTIAKTAAKAKCHPGVSQADGGTDRAARCALGAPARIGYNARMASLSSKTPRVLLLLAALLAGPACKSPSAPKAGNEAPQEIPPQALLPLPEDEDALALRLAMDELRDRFKCNDVSGCPVRDRILAWGPRSRTALEDVFRLSAPQAPYRLRVVEILADLGDTGAELFLLERTKDKDDFIRAHALRGIANLELRAHLDRVRVTLHQTSPQNMPATHAAAAFAMAKLGDRTGLGSLIETVKPASQAATNPWALRFALDRCRDLRERACIPGFLAAADNPDYFARRAAMAGLRLFPDKSYVPKLIVCLRDPVVSLRRDAEDLLVSLTGTRQPNEEAWTAWCTKAACENWAPDGTSKSASVGPLRGLPDEPTPTAQGAAEPKGKKPEKKKKR